MQGESLPRDTERSTVQTSSFDHSQYMGSNVARLTFHANPPRGYVPISTWAHLRAPQPAKQEETRRNNYSRRLLLNIHAQPHVTSTLRPGSAEFSLVNDFQIPPCWAPLHREQFPAVKRACVLTTCHLPFFPQPRVLPVLGSQTANAGTSSLVRLVPKAQS